MAGAVGAKEEEAFKQMLIVDSLRGVHSTGCAIIPRHGPVKMAKTLGNPFNLLDSKSFEKAMAGINRVLIGHNRYATQGKISAVNAHPFDFDTLVGAHNGTLTSKWKLHNSANYDVDSENLYHHIEEKGLVDALDNMQGAWALTWWDKVTQELNILRNKERPLFLARSVDGKVLFWASEEWMLSGILPRAGLHIGEVFLLEADTHLTIKVKDNGEMEKARAALRPSTFRGYVYQGYSGGGQVVPFQQQQRSQTQQTSTTPAQTTTAGGTGVNPPQGTPSTPVTTTSSQTVTGYDSYEGSKNVSLEVKNCAIDGNGARYWNCTDVLNPSKTIRLYYTAKGDTADFTKVGKTFTCTIGSAHVSVTGRFYKVNSSSVKWDNESAPEETSAERLYYDHSNRAISRNEWVSRYGTCDWCSDNISPDDDQAHLTRQGESLCAGCTSDPEIGKFVDLIERSKVPHPF